MATNLLYFQSTNLRLLRISYTMELRNCAYGMTAFIACGKPFRPSTAATSTASSFVDRHTYRLHGKTLSYDFFHNKFLKGSFYKKIRRSGFFYMCTNYWQPPWPGFKPRTASQIVPVVIQTMFACPAVVVGVITAAMLAPAPVVAAIDDALIAPLAAVMVGTAKTNFVVAIVGIDPEPMATQFVQAPSVW